MRILPRRPEEKKKQGEGIIKMINESEVCCYCRLCCFFSREGDVPFPVGETIISCRKCAGLGGKKMVLAATVQRLKWQSKCSYGNDTDFVAKWSMGCFLRACSRLNTRGQGVCLHRDD